MGCRHGRRQYLDTAKRAISREPGSQRMKRRRAERLVADAECNGRHQEANEKLMDRQTLSIMKACEVVGVSRRTIYNWISAGKVEYVRTAGGSIRIFADTLWRDAAAPRARCRRTADARPRGIARVKLRRSPADARRTRAGLGRGASRAVPPAEQPAGDHPGARRVARSESRRRGAVVRARPQL